WRYRIPSCTAIAGRAPRTGGGQFWLVLAGDAAVDGGDPLPVGYGAFMRALLVALFEWVEHGVAPPASRFPSRASGPLVALAESRATFPKLPQVNFPNVLNELRLRDHSVEPPIESLAVVAVKVVHPGESGQAVGCDTHRHD